ncbi:hypothetical protein MBLNU13_g09890t1 [Cladosporium sp. NU13]
MAEPQPSAIHEGASTPPAPPAAAAASAAAEAAALDSLDNKTLSDASSAPKKEIDLKALNDAMKALDSGAGGKKVSAAAAAAGGLKKDEEPAKLIKVDAADVSLLAEQLDLSRPKATELLRAHDADAVRAMKAWVSAAV